MSAIISKEDLKHEIEELGEKLFRAGFTAVKTISTPTKRFEPRKKFPAWI